MPSGQPGLRLVADAVVPVAPAGVVHAPGVVDVVGDRVAWVGPAADAPPTGAQTLDVGGLLMPGLVNTHAHTPMTLFRGAGDGLPLLRWLTEAIWPREARMEDADARVGMLLGAHELLTCGVTTTCEMYLHGRAVLEASVDSGIRCVYTAAIFDLPGAGPGATWQAFLEQARQLHQEFDGAEGRITVGFAPHAAYTVPPAGLEAAAAAALEHDALLQIHVAETADEDRAVRDEHGCSVPGLLARLGVLEARVLAAHSIWLDRTDLDLYGAHDVAVAHCPGSNAKLGSGVAPLAEFLRRGIRVGLGTDGPASNDDLDLWEELRLAPQLARATAGDPAAVSTETALDLATAGGARALGLAAGTLTPGALADVVRLDLDDSRFVPALDHGELVSHLVWAASSRLVTDVWVGGRRVVADRRCLTVDGPAVRAEARARAVRLAGSGGVRTAP
jgi:5-methylthioadenosine/S-adenosylhomocysteine deaminase